MKTVTPALPERHKGDGCCAPTVAPRLTPSQTATLAERLKALADPTRLGMLDLLAQQEAPLCVCDITPRFPQNQPTISHHLRVLRQAGLIGTDKRAIWTYYWVTDEGRRSLAAIHLLT